MILHRDLHENIAMDLMTGVPTMVLMINLAGRGMMVHHISHTQVQIMSVEEASTSQTNRLMAVSLVKRPIAAGGGRA